MHNCSLPLQTTVLLSYSIVLMNLVLHFTSILLMLSLTAIRRAARS